MLRILIIEDEALAAEKLEMLLRQIREDLEVLAVIPSVSEAVSWLSLHRADLIFVDINLNDDLSFKIFEQVPVETPLIFTTAYDQFAIRAFEQNSIAYLLKPIDPDALQAALEKFDRYTKNSGPADILRLQQMMQELQQKQTQAYRDRIMVSYGGKIRTISTQDVAVYYAYEKATYLVTMTGTRYVLDETLEKIAGRSDPKNFFRVNRRYLLNIRAINEVQSYSSRKLRIITPVETPDMVLVPAEKITHFKRWLNQE